MSDAEHQGEGEADLFAHDMTHDDDVPSFPAGVGMADVMAKILGQVHLAPRAASLDLDEFNARACWRAMATTSPPHDSCHHRRRVPACACTPETGEWLGGWCMGVMWVWVC